MMQHDIRRLVVARDGAIVGIVTEGDLVNAVEQFGWVRAE